jgi:hypothetical protein
MVNIPGIIMTIIMGGLNIIQTILIQMDIIIITGKIALKDGFI